MLRRGDRFALAALIASQRADNLTVRVDEYFTAGTFGAGAYATVRNLERRANGHASGAWPFAFLQIGA